MELINLGKSNKGIEISFDLRKLITTRLLVQASSGGGKSWAIRRLLEQSHGRVQQIVIDIEGEFPSLRQRYDYVIAGKGGDAPADIKSAKLLARKLLELEASMICDISDLKKHERFSFVKIFIESLISSHKNLWHPVLIIVDEAHQFCPQNGKAETRDAIIDLCTRGRKRGLCAVLSTQRLSKLHKDACAELLNKMIGRTSLDIDQRRAGDELGLPKTDWRGLRNFEPGDFSIYGPALFGDNKQSGDVIHFKVGSIETKHPEIGIGLFEAPPTPSNKVREILAKLQDLPEAAAKETKELADLQRENTDLKRKLTLAEKARPEPKPCGHEPIIKKLQNEISGYNEDYQKIIRLVNIYRNQHAEFTNTIKYFNDKAVDLLGRMAASLDELTGKVSSNISKAEKLKITPFPLDAIENKVSFPSINQLLDDMPKKVNPGDDNNTPRPMQKILNALAALEQFGISNITKATLAAHSGYSPGSGGYNNLLSKLRTAGLIDYPGPGRVELTEAGRIESVNENPITCLEDLHKSWVDVVKSKSQKKILTSLINCFPERISRDDLAVLNEFSPGSGGFNNNLSKLKTLGAIEYPQKCMVRASSLLFPKEFVK